MLMKDSLTAVSNQWSLPVNIRGGDILFGPWSTRYKVKGPKVQFEKKEKNLVEIMTMSSDKISFKLVMGLV